MTPPARVRSGHSVDIMAILLVASAGGHLQQLRMLADRLESTDDRCWVTFDTPQARSMLHDETVEYVPYVAPRGYRDLLTCLPQVPRIYRRRHVTSVVSTGSGVALAFLPFGAARGIPTHYIESATRVEGPSYTGRLLARVPRVRVYTQWEHWSDERWGFAGSVFDGFQSEDAVRPDPSIRRVVVSLGTIRPYGFRRLVERLVDTLPETAEVLWQTGATDVSGLGIDAVPELDGAVLRAAMRDADVVIAHAGTGVALTALEEGKVPLLVPRRVDQREHVDDHQLQTAQILAERRLAISTDVNELTHAHLLAASARRACRTSSPPPLRLKLPATGN